MIFPILEAARRDQLLAPVSHLPLRYLRALCSTSPTYAAPDLHSRKTLLIL